MFTHQRTISVVPVTGGGVLLESNVRVQGRATVIQLTTGGFTYKVLGAKPVLIALDDIIGARAVESSIGRTFFEVFAYVKESVGCGGGGAQDGTQRVARHVTVEMVGADEEQASSAHNWADALRRHSLRTLTRCGSCLFL